MSSLKEGQGGEARLAGSIYRDRQVVLQVGGRVCHDLRDASNGEVRWSRVVALESYRMGMILEKSTSWIKALLREPIVNSSRMDQWRLVQSTARVKDAVAMKISGSNKPEILLQYTDLHYLLVLQINKLFLEQFRKILMQTHCSLHQYIDQVLKNKWDNHTKETYFWIKHPRKNLMRENRCNNSEAFYY